MPDLSLVPAVRSYTPKQRKKHRDRRKEIKEAKAAQKVALLHAGVVSAHIPIPDHIKTFEDFCSSIVTRTGDGLKSITLYDWQHGLIRSLRENTTTQVIKSRQVGGTTVLLAYALYQAITDPGYLALFVSRKGADALLLGQRYRRLVESLPWLKEYVDSDALQNPRFKNQSAALFRSAEPPDSCGRSVEAANLCVYDECSFYLDLGAVLGSTASAQVQVTDPRSVFISTPNGRAEYFFSMLTRAPGEVEFDRVLDSIRAKQTESYYEFPSSNGVQTLIAHWRCIPKFLAEADFLGRIKVQLGLTDDVIAQEYELGFEISDSTVYPLIGVNSAVLDEDWREDPEPDGVYYIGIDPVGVAKGTKGDYCAAIVMRKEWVGGVEQYRVVNTYHKKSGRQTSEVMISGVSDMIREYQPIKVVCEKNAMGVVWGESLTSLNPGTDFELFVATNQSKEMVSGRLAICLESEQIKVPKIVANELLSYRRIPSVTGNTSTLEAAKGSHDDLHDALCLGLLASGYNPLAASGLFA